MSEQQRGVGHGGGFLASTPSLIVAAHELKSPLALVRQLAFAIETGAGDTAENAQRIVITADRALRLASDITRYARLEDSFFVTEPLNAQMLCEEVVQEISPLYQAYNRRLIVAGRQSSPLIVANRELLRRVLLGFADNALHYAAPDEPVTLTVKLRRLDQTVRLSVRDFGPAVASDVLRVVEDQTNARPTALHHRPESSGLGLYLARQFAGAMQASIGVTRHKNGASFYIDIPESRQLSLL